MDKHILKTIKVNEWSARKHDWETRETTTCEEVKIFFDSKIFKEWYDKNHSKPCKINKSMTNSIAVDIFSNPDKITSLAFKNFIKIFGTMIELKETNMI